LAAYDAREEAEAHAKAEERASEAKAKAEERAVEAKEKAEAAAVELRTPSPELLGLLTTAKRSTPA
jgi:membrane protein involved in colicin uptake